jgi:predicted regulator of Ras-like GTPase activity (Roadblock/LC7/MglB family)
MLRKLFGRSTSSPTPNSRRVNEALSQLVLGIPAILRATLVTSTGLARGSFPRQVVEDRISAMSAAIMSLGERICSELGSGDMRYAIIAGDKTMQLLIVLSEDYALELELRPNVSMDETLGAVWESVKPLLQAIRLPDGKTWEDSQR